MKLLMASGPLYLRRNHSMKSLQANTSVKTLTKLGCLLSFSCELYKFSIGQSGLWYERDGDPLA